jgi:hypothetical protein
VDFFLALPLLNGNATDNENLTKLQINCPCNTVPTKHLLRKEKVYTMYVFFKTQVQPLAQQSFGTVSLMVGKKKSSENDLKNYVK